MAYESTGPDVKSSNPSSSDAPGLAREATQAAADLGRTAARKADQARSRAAAGLESAAQSLHSGVDRMASAGHGAGDALAGSARYVRDHDLSDMSEDLLEVVRNNPGVALLGAAALGFLVGWALNRD